MPSANQSTTSPLRCPPVQVACTTSMSPPMSRGMMKAQVRRNRLLMVGRLKGNCNFMVTYFDACEILEMLSEASVKVFLDGGWGVDALIGRETRIHNDIDLFVEKKDYGKAISVITWKGYREVVMDYTTDSHTVWKDDNGRIIDLHCFEYVEDGILYDGYTFPSETFSGKGNIGNIEVTCINPEAQVQFHLGYEYDENDVHDVLLLCRTFNLEIPEQYKTHI